MSTLHEELLISPDISLQAQIQNSQFICELASFKIPALWGALAGLSAVESKLTYQLRPSNKNTKYLKYLWAFISPKFQLDEELERVNYQLRPSGKKQKRFLRDQQKKMLFCDKKDLLIGLIVQRASSLSNCGRQAKCKRGSQAFSSSMEKSAIGQFRAIL